MGVLLKSTACEVMLSEFHRNIERGLRLVFPLQADGQCKVMAKQGQGNKAGKDASQKDAGSVALGPTPRH